MVDWGNGLEDVLCFHAMFWLSLTLYKADSFKVSSRNITNGEPFSTKCTSLMPSCHVGEPHCHLSSALMCVTTLCCPFHPLIYYRQQSRTRVTGSGGARTGRKRGGPVIVLAALLTPWQAQRVLSSISQAEGGVGNLGEADWQGSKAFIWSLPWSSSLFCPLYFPIMTGSGSPDWLLNDLE